MTDSQAWQWKMEWCKRHHLPPANPHFWRLAEEALAESEKGK